MFEDSYAPDAASASPGAAPVAKISLRLVARQVRWFDRQRIRPQASLDHFHPPPMTADQMQAALEALVRLVEAGKPLAHPDLMIEGEWARVGDMMFRIEDWRDTMAALAQFTDDREKKP